MQIKHTLVFRLVLALIALDKGAFMPLHMIRKHGFNVVGFRTLVTLVGLLSIWHMP